MRFTGFVMLALFCALTCISQAWFLNICGRTLTSPPTPVRDADPGSSKLCEPGIVFLVQRII